MSGGLFITLYDRKTLSLYLKQGIYGFLMKPVFEERPSNRSMHYAALADYACSREGTHVFFFLQRTIVYGGVVTGSREFGSFYLNGDTSPLGRKANAPLFWDESSRYTPTDKPGVFKVNGTEKAQPFILLFEQVDGCSGKIISSDDMYFELGQYPYPLPSNSIRGMSFCTLTPGETETALRLCSSSTEFFSTVSDDDITIGDERTIFTPQLLYTDEFQNEAHIEFSLLADLSKIYNLFQEDDYVLCRQVPISPFKPFQIDRADICLYSMNRPIKDGTIPNVILELKKDRANFHAYNQMSRYLKWLQKITSQDEFDSIEAILVAPSFYVLRQKVNTEFSDKIKMFSLNTQSLYILQ